MQRDYSIRDADGARFLVCPDDIDHTVSDCVEDLSDCAEEEDTSDSCLQCFVKEPSIRPFSWRIAWVVLLVAALVGFTGPHVFMKMLSKTHNVGWEAPRGSEALVSEELASRAFPNRLKGAIILAVEALDGTPTVLTDSVKQWSEHVVQRVKEDPRVQGFGALVLGYYVSPHGVSIPDKYRNKAFVSPDEKMTIVVIQPTKLDGYFAQANQVLVDFCTSPPDGYVLHITGMPSISAGTGCCAGQGAHTHVDTRTIDFEILFRAELCTIPVAIFIIFYIVRYERLLLLPLITLAIAQFIGASILIPWMDAVWIPKDVPTAMGSVTMAVSLDYSLFVLSRFTEHHDERWPLQRNIDTILRCTGQTIFVSGTLICISFFATWVLPEENLRGAGMCMGFATLACVATSLTVTPAILLVASRWLTRSPCIETSQDDSDGASSFPIRRKPQQSHWLRVVRLVHKSPVVALVVVLAALSPILRQSLNLNITGDRFAVLPMNMPALCALRVIQSRDFFALGALDPFAVVLTAPNRSADSPVMPEVLASAKEFNSRYMAEHVSALASEVGFNKREAASVVKAVTDVANGRDIDDDFLEDVLHEIGIEQTTIVAAEAGAAAGLKHATGASVRDCVRAAFEVACQTTDQPDGIKRAVGAAAASLHMRFDKDSQLVQAVQQNITLEATQHGMSDADAHAVGLAAAQGLRGGKHAESAAGFRTTLAAAEVGMQIGLRKAILHADDPHASEHALRVAASAKNSDLSSAELAEVMRAAQVVIRKATKAPINKVGTLQTRVSAASGSVSHKLRPLRNNVSGAVKSEASKLGLSPRVASLLAKAATLADPASGTSQHHVLIKTTDQILQRLSTGKKELFNGEDRLGASIKWRMVSAVIKVVEEDANGKHGELLMPQGYEAMVDLCHALHSVGHVRSMLGPSWVFYEQLDWMQAVMIHATQQHLYNPLFHTHVNGPQALLEVHTSFPTMGAGGADWVLDARKAIRIWEAKHPGYSASLSGGASAAADTRSLVLEGMWTYLALSVTLIMCVVLLTFRSLLMPLRLSLALIVTLGATFGVAVIIYQTPLLHGIFPCLAAFNGLTYEVVPVATCVAIALGLDYDIFLVSRIVEFRMQGYSDRASIFRGTAKTGGVISGAGLIMALAFSGLCFADKLLLQQFGVLLITSVLFDTFVVRTVLVPALMLIAEGWNWWPRRMPPPVIDSCEGDEEEDEEEEDEDQVEAFRQRGPEPEDTECC